MVCRMLKSLRLAVLRLSLAATAMIGVASDRAAAQAPPPCMSHFNVQVPYLPDTTLPNVGIATYLGGQPIIIMNPRVLERFSPLMRMWWYLHECGHHALPPHLNNEVNADCYAARRMRDMGFVRTQSDLMEICAQLSTLPGNIWSGHLPGPGRCEVVVQCTFN